MTTTNDIRKAVAEIEERWKGKYLDLQIFADLKALLFATKALLSEVQAWKDSRDGVMAHVEELKAELTAYREQADKPEDIAELARQVARHAGAFKELAKTKKMLDEMAAERDRYLKALEWIVEVDDNGGEECAGCYDNCDRCYAEKAREALGKP